MGIAGEGTVRGRDYEHDMPEMQRGRENPRGFSSNGV